LSPLILVWLIIQHFQLKVNISIIQCISSKTILDKEALPSHFSKKIIKSEFVSDVIREVVKPDGVTKSLFTSEPVFSLNEMKNIIQFLMGFNQQKVKDNVSDISEPKNIQAPPKKSYEVSEGVKTFCKHCNSVNLTPKHGRYGYFFNCNDCKKNTPMKYDCPQCSSSNAKVRKKTSTYTLECGNCNSISPINYKN